MRRSVVGVVALATGIVAGCTRSATPPVEAPLPTVPNTSSARGPCANPYLPSAAGDAWYYRVTYEGHHDTFADTVTTVGDRSFVITSNYALAARGATWTCEPDGLASIGGAGSTITTSLFGQTLAAHHGRGLTLPAHPTPGDRWRQSFDIVTRGLLPATGSVRIRYQALRFDRIATRAGRFRALLVHSLGRYDLTSRGGGPDDHVVYTVVTAQWWARGVGLVRQDVERHEGGGTTRVLQELTKFERGPAG